jgi:TolB protein
MFQKTIKTCLQFLFLALVGAVLNPSDLLAVDPSVRIELERTTHQTVKVALTQFVMGKKSRDPEGLGEDARKILENDLRLSELFMTVASSVYEDLEQKDRESGEVDFWAWHRVGVQWLIKTDYQVTQGRLKLTFRLYDTVSELRLLGKVYASSKNLMRKSVHRFADELVLQLTGKRGVAETKLIFLSDENGSREIFVTDFDGHNQTQLTRDHTLNLTPIWSPDGEWIVYTSYGANNPDLVMMGAKGKKSKRTLLRLPGLNAAPAWSPVGTRLALVLSKDRNPEIYLLEKNRRLKRLTRHFNIDTSPTWSSDGKRIAFASDRSGTGAPQIYIMNVDQGDRGPVERISFGSSHNDNPAWSPDGDKIAYTSRVGKRFQIKIYDLNTKKNITFTDTKSPGNNEQPTWSPDGRFIAYRHKEGAEPHIYIQRLGSDRARQLSFRPGGGLSPDWSPYPMSKR